MLYETRKMNKSGVIATAGAIPTQWSIIFVVSFPKADVALGILTAGEV